MRVGLLHFGQSVLFDVSITFLRSAVLAILAMLETSPSDLWILGIARSEVVRNQCFTERLRARNLAVSWLSLRTGLRTARMRWEGKEME
jgi:hypothetical protein